MKVVQLLILMVYQLISTRFRGSDLGVGEMVVILLLVYRYTGKGRNNRVISSRGQSWIMGHHGNRNAAFFMNGWVHQGNAADTDFHIWEIKQEGRTMEIHLVPFTQTVSN